RHQRTDGNELVVKQGLFRERQGFHDETRLSDVSRVEEENSAFAVFSRIPFADFSIEVELDRCADLRRHNGHDLLASYAGLGFQQRKNTGGLCRGGLSLGLSLV